MPNAQFFMFPNDIDFLSIDGPKDGRFELMILRHFKEFGLRPGALLVFDDTRFLNMVEHW